MYCVYVILYCVYVIIYCVCNYVLCFVIMYCVLCCYVLCLCNYVSTYSVHTEGSENTTVKINANELIEGDKPTTPAQLTKV